MIKKYNLWKNCISLQVQEQNNQMCFLSSMSWAQHADGPPAYSVFRESFAFLEHDSWKMLYNTSKES